jgi:8-oxo-dGTP pyrophosphatase MutT (NUDIX family)
MKAGAASIDTASADWIGRARARFGFAPDYEDAFHAAAAQFGDHALNPGQIELREAIAAAKPAAVLIGLVPREDGVKVLLTERSAHLRAHSGQVAFPGGRIDADDSGPLAAAMREAHEEIGLQANRIDPIGQLEPYLTGSGYRIIPVIAEIRTPFALDVNADEVAGVFEAPLDFLMDVGNHTLQQREWKGVMRRYYEMPWNGHYIWGVTAGILRLFTDRLRG